MAERTGSLVYLRQFAIGLGEMGPDALKAKDTAVTSERVDAFVDDVLQSYVQLEAVSTPDTDTKKTPDDDAARRCIDGRPDLTGGYEVAACVAGGSFLVVPSDALGPQIYLDSNRTPNC